MTDSLIHMRVPAALKGRWVRLSRAAGMRLTDWIINAVEAQMQYQMTNITIPDDIGFADLRLQRMPDGSVSFDTGVITRICEASGVSPDIFLAAAEDNIAGLIIAWYARHRAGGGAPDPAAEDIIAEAAAEDAAGQPYSLPPGTA